MELENKMKQKLILRGFTEKQLLNNRGLIGAIIDETILKVFKNWWNSLPDESDDKLYMTDKTIDRFLKSNSD